MAAHKYDCRIDLTADTGHTRVIRLVGRGKRVLELGCATGYMAKVLVDRFGCTVTGIEADPDAAREAAKICRRVVAGDVEGLDYGRELGSERFDVIVCADVLEHLREPDRVLAALRPFLAPNGYVVASIPNIAHASVIAELLEGRFRYRPLGLLDDTHLRFFTRDSIYACFETAGFVISWLERIRLEPEVTEFRTDLSRFPPDLVRAIRAHEESTTYQFVVTAHPAPDASRAGALRDAVMRPEAPAAAIGWPARPEGSDSEAASRGGRVEGLSEAILGRMKFLEGERDRLQREIGHRDGQLARLREDAARRGAEVGPHPDDIDLLRTRLAALQTQVAEIQSGPGWAALQRFRRLRLKVMPRDSLRERLYLALLRAMAGGARKRT